MNKPISKIHFVEFNAKYNSLAIRQIFPKYGVPLLATILKEKGYDVTVYLEGVSDMSFGKMADCDLVCLSMFSPNFNKVKEFALRVRKEKPGLPVIVGGPYVCLQPESVLGFCSYAVRCEGDEVLPELICCLENGGDVSRVRGISYLKGESIVHHPEAEPPEIPATAPDLGLIDGFPEAPEGLAQNPVVNTLQTSRGCTYHCKFCPTSKLFGGRYRNRDIDSIIRDIRSKTKYHHVFFVVDNNFFGDRERTRALLERLIAENTGAAFIIFARHEIGYDEEMLDLMNRANIRCAIVGVESLSDDALKSYNKEQSANKVIGAIDNMLAHGIHVLGTFIFGSDQDTPEKAREIVDFVKKTGISLNIFPLGDIRNHPSDDLLIPLNRRFRTHYKKTDPANTNYFDYGGLLVSYFPKRMKPSTLQKCLLGIYRDVYSHQEVFRSLLSDNIFGSFFRFTHGYSIRRLTLGMERIVDGFYMDFLHRVEQGLYDENEMLIEEKLDELQGLPLLPPLQEATDLESYNLHIRLGFFLGLTRLRLMALRARLQS